MFLAKRLKAAGLECIFGVPGDYVLTFFDCLEESGLKVISGVSGSIEEVVASFVRGELDTTKAACCNHHGEHGHGCHHN